MTASVEIRLTPMLVDEPGELELEALRHRDRGAVIYPTRALASWRAVNLIRDGQFPGIFGPFCSEFSGFALEILRESGIDPVLMDSRERRLLAWQCLETVLEVQGDLPEIRIQDTALPGVAAHLLDVITALKQAGIPPETFEERMATEKYATPVDRLVLEVYQRYQGQLVASGSCDIPGLYWLAEEVVRNRGDAALRGLRYLFLDGFEDFTPSQIRLLKELAPRLERMVIRAHYDTSSGRDREFLLQQRCLKALRGLETAGVRFQVIEESSPRLHSTGQWLAAWFGSRVPVDRAAESGRVTGLRNNTRLMPCVDVHDEADRIARNIRRQVLERGENPGDVAVAVPDIQESGWIFERAFERQEVPCARMFSRSMAESLAGGVALLLVRLMEGFDAMLALELVEHPLAGPAERRPDSQVREQLPELFRRLLPRVTWPYPEEALERHLAELSRVDGGTCPWESPARWFISWCQWLRQVRGMFPESADARTFVVALETVLRCLEAESLLSARAGGMDPDAAEAELAAGEILGETLARVYDVAAPDRQMTRETFVDLFRRILVETPWPGGTSRHGVLLGGMDLLRRPGIRRLYVAGMNEGLFPAVNGASVVYGPESLARVGRALGVTLEGPREKALRQSLLFLGALERDREAIVLSWRLQGPDGSEMFPGSFLEEIRFLAGKAGLDLDDGRVPVPGELPRDMETIPGVFHDAMTRAAVAGRGEAAERMWRRAAELAGPERTNLLHAARHGIEVERRRHDRLAPFDQYDGMLRGEDTRQWIAERFGPERVFSVTRLEQYLKCPYTFFVSEVLGVDERDVPLSGLEVRPTVRGSLAHEVLEWVFSDSTRYREPPGADTLFEVYRKCAERYRLELANLSPGLLEEELRYLAGKTARFLRKHLESCGDAEGETLGAGLEISFGRRVRNGEAPDPSAERFPVLRSTPQPLLLEWDGMRARIAGQIDRIDVLNPETRVCRIVDYKTGQVPAPAAIKQGSDVQLMLYARAMQQLFGWTCDAAWYVSVTDPDSATKLPERLRARKKDDPTYSMSDADLWAHGMERALETVKRAVIRLREGCFPPVTWNGEAEACVPSGRYQDFRIRAKALMGGWDTPGEEVEDGTENGEEE